jgi:hypothetical protein
MSKSITYGLLAFAVSSSLLVAQGEKPAGGWSAKAGSGITYDGGDQFGINMLNFVQTRWTFENNENRADNNSFDVPRARTLLRGHAFNKNINYVLQVDYRSASSETTVEDDGSGGFDVATDSDSIVRDAYVHWNFADGIGLRMGQGKTQWGLENTGTIRGTMFTERSSASQAFVGGGDNPRTQGAWLMGTAVENKLRWSLAAITSAPAAVSGGSRATCATATASWRARLAPATAWTTPCRPPSTTPTPRPRRSTSTRRGRSRASRSWASGSTAARRPTTSPSATT